MGVPRKLSRVEQTAMRAGLVPALREAAELLPGPDADPEAVAAVDASLDELLGRMADDVDLAADALAMNPRPDWLTELVGGREVMA